jgi:hypothetical protein
MILPLVKFIDFPHKNLYNCRMQNDRDRHHAALDAALKGEPVADPNAGDYQAEFTREVLACLLDPTRPAPECLRNMPPAGCVFED